MCIYRNYQLSGEIELFQSTYFKDNYKKSNIPRRKHGHVFIFFEKTTNKIQIHMAEQRNVETLSKLIFDNIDPASTIFSQIWEHYGGIFTVSKNIAKSYVGYKINLLNETDSSSDGWKTMKESMQHLHRNTRHLFPTYIFQYLYKRIYNNQNIFQHLLTDIRRQHSFGPVPDEYFI